MDSTLLCNLRGGSRNVTLRLRLLHMWLAKTPSGSRIFNHCCLWVDQTGMLIQSLSDPEMAKDTERALRVGTIYVISKFGLHQARGLYRSCSFDLTMHVTRSTDFQACTLPVAGFPTESFEIMPFDQLHTRNGNHAILTDVIGRLHAISGIGHQITEFGSTPKQNLVLENDRGETFTVTLWNELATLLDPAALIQADLIELVIIAIGGLMISMVNEICVGSSSSGTRVAVNPQVPEAFHLAARFEAAREPVAELPVQFATAAEAAADADQRTRNVSDLLDLHHSGASVETKHCCQGVVTSVESRSPWYYTSCSMCSRKCSTWRDNAYWCPKHWEISEQQVRIGYKIQLTLKDFTAEAPFIVFGSCGNALTHTTAPILARRYPHRPGQLPPELEVLNGRSLKFEVKLPMVAANGLSTGEFRVLRVFPEEGAGLPLPAPHVVPNTVVLSQEPGVSQATSQSSQDVSLGQTQSAVVDPAPSVPDSSAKGKEKMSAPVVVQNRSPVFRIGEPMMPVSSHLGSGVCGPMSNVEGGPNLVASGSSATTVLHASDVPLPHGVVSSAADKMMAAEKEVTDYTSAAIDKNVVASIDPPAHSVVSAGHKSALVGYSQAVSSHLPSSLNEGDQTPQSKVARQSSPAETLSSPYTKLLSSPLARVKLEKLDGAAAKDAKDDSAGSASVGEDSGVGLRASKRTPVKRRLYDV